MDSGKVLAGVTIILVIVLSFLLIHTAITQGAQKDKVGFYDSVVVAGGVDPVFGVPARAGLRTGNFEAGLLVSFVPTDSQTLLPNYYGPYISVTMAELNRLGLGIDLSFLVSNDLQYYYLVPGLSLDYNINSSTYVTAGFNSYFQWNNQGLQNTGLTTNLGLELRF